MRKIRLYGKNGVGNYALIDDEYYEILSTFRWTVNSKGYATADLYSKMVNRRKFSKSIRMHRLVAILANWDIERKFIDHQFHQTLDNQKHQLRISNNSQNKANGLKYQRKTGNNTKYKGATWVERDQRWSARIRVKTKCIFLGYYKKDIEAAKAYDEAARKYFGEFAMLNFP